MERYIAFISYRHQPAAEQVSYLLRKQLETIHLPKDAPLPKKRRVFRDTDELPTSTDLGADIENALQDSRWLICICSEDYPVSKWCVREVEEFLELGRKDRILPVLISGEKETAFPELIRDLPVAADLRCSDEKEQKKRVRLAIPELLAKMTGMEAERFAAARRRHALTMAAGTVGVITAALLGFALYASNAADRIAHNNVLIEQATQESETAREEAVLERNEALRKNDQYLCEKAWEAIAEEDDENAIRLALSALPEDLHGDDPVYAEAVGALRVALSMPARPKDNYRFERSVETDFEITGYLVTYEDRDRVFLTTKETGLREYYMIYDDGTTGEQEFPMRQKAIEEGYSLGYQAESGSPMHQVYYGPERQMLIDGNSATESSLRYITLNGEPFYADHILEAPSYSMLAWLEDPLEGQNRQTAVLYMTRSAAVGPLDITGSPVSASFSGNHRRVAIVDEEGTLSLFDTETGARKAVLDGRFSRVSYPNAASVFCAVKQDGTAALYDAVTLEEKVVFESPAPIRSILYCSEKGTFLACCADGARIYKQEDGKLLFTVTTDEEPVFAVWGGYDDYLYTHKGTSFVIGFSNRIDTYVLDTETDKTQTDYLPLYQQGVEAYPESAVYSPDGKYIYLAYTNRGISKWEAATGKLVWVNPESGKYDSGVDGGAALSLDQKALWRSNYEGTGLQKVDAETGGTIYTAELGQRTGLPMESPDGKLAVAESQYGQVFVCFDAQTGEKLWQTEGLDDCFFTEDSRELYAVKEERDEDAGTTRILFLRIDAETGKELEQRTLLEVADGTYEEGYFSMITEKDSACLIVKYTVFASNRFSYSKADKDRSVFWAYTLPDGECFWHHDFTDRYVSASFSYTGVPVLYWTDEEELDWCMRLYRDGSAGEALEADSEEGRKLTTVKERHGFFAGEEVSIHRDEGCSLKRISDGAVMLSLGNQSASYDIALAPDGSSACLYDYYVTPCVILASDADLLVQKARKRIGGEAS